MAFEIDLFEPVEFDIPAGKGKKITLTAPPYDCISVADTTAMNEKLAEYEKNDDIPQIENPAKNVPALMRFMLKYFNPGKQKADAIDALVTRQLMQIDKLWSEASGVEVGESSPSTDDSSETED